MYNMGDKLFLKNINNMFEINGIFPAGQDFKLNITGNHFKVVANGFSGILSEGLLDLLMTKEIKFEKQEEVKTGVNIDVNLLTKADLLILAKLIKIDITDEIKAMKVDELRNYLLGGE